MQQFLSDPDSRGIDLESHCLALVIAKKILDENQLKHAKNTTNCTSPNFKVSNRVFFKNKQPGKWDLKWRAGYRIVSIGCNRHYLYIENQASGKTRPCSMKDVVHKLPVHLWNIDTTFGRDGKFINHPTNLPTIPLIHLSIRYLQKKTVTHKIILFQSTLHRDPSRKGYTML